MSGENGWGKVPLGDVCRLVNGKAFKPSDWSNDGRPIIRIQNLNDATKSFNYWAGPLDRQVMVNAGDVLIGWSGTPGTSFGAHIWYRQQGVLNQHIFRVDLDDTRIAKEWAVPAINHQLEVLIGKAHGGVGLRHVKKSEVEALQIPFPPLAEQKRIAGILKEQLATVEQARAAAEAQLEAAKALPAAYLRDVFEGPASVSWQRRRIGDFAKVQSGYAFKSEWFVDDGIRLLRNANIFQNRIEWDDVVCLPETQRPAFSAFELSAGDIVLTLDRPIVSNGLKVARLTKGDVPALLLQRVGRFQFRCDGIESDYLFSFLNSPSFIKQITGHDQSLGVPHISPKQVESIELPVPDKGVQQELAKRLGKKLKCSESVLNSLRQRLHTIEAMPAALLRAAFQGRL